MNHQHKVNLKQQMNEDDDELDLRRGPWTVDEDLTLINYIAHHGEGRWNSLAHFAGLKRTGKSCRLRWLNYLRPDVRRGNITLEEQLLILELHSRWGNKWSKIAQHLPGRTDNEIKNYWRTRVQKHAKQLKCDVNSKQFKDTMRYLWMPRLVERIQAAAGAPPPPSAAVNQTHDSNGNVVVGDRMMMMTQEQSNQHNHTTHSSILTSDNSSNVASSESFGTPLSDLAESNYTNFHGLNNDHLQVNGSMSQDQCCYYHPDAVRDHQISNGAVDNYCNQEMGFDFSYDQQSNHQWMLDDGDNDGYLWNNVDDDLWFLQNQFDGNF